MLYQIHNKFEEILLREAMNDANVRIEAIYPVKRREVSCTLQTTYLPLIDIATIIIARSTATENNRKLIVVATIVITSSTATMSSRNSASWTVRSSASVRRTPST